MNIDYNLKLIYKILNEIKYNLFCGSICCSRCCYTYCKQECDKDNCNDICESEDENLLKNISCEFLEDNIYLEGCYKCNCEEETCISLIDLLIKVVCEIEEACKCSKNYGFLLQVNKLICILKNLKNLLCQLRCLCVKDCDLISKALCSLYQIIELLGDIVSKINNIGCLFESDLCCKCEIINCMVCELEEEVNCLEKIVANLSCIVLEIASKDIINCASCQTSECSKSRKRDYYNKYKKINCKMDYL